MTIKTKVHYYLIDTTTSKGRKEYKELTQRIEADGPEGRGRWLKAMPSNRNSGHKNGDTEEVEIEVNCIFDNQWNTTEKRIFDWFEAAVFVNGREGTSIRWGHWTEITAEMTAARQNTLKCGYCGKHYGPYHEPVPADHFCTACLDSPYLKRIELYLTRLLPLVRPQMRDLLTEAEADRLTPEYVRCQTVAAGSRTKEVRKKQRTNVIAKHSNQITTANDEKDGMLWLLNHGFGLDNVIYYSHTRKFCFGWRSPIDSTVLSTLLGTISEFPFAYEVKTDDGQELTG